MKVISDEMGIDSNAENIPVPHGTVSIVSKSKPPKNVLLPVSDVMVQVEPRKGKHTLIAQQMMQGDQENYFPAMMHLLVSHNGQKFAMEDFKEMDGEDFDILMVEIAGNLGTPK